MRQKISEARMRVVGEAENCLHLFERLPFRPCTGHGQCGGDAERREEERVLAVFHELTMQIQCKGVDGLCQSFGILDWIVKLGFHRHYISCDGSVSCE